MILRRTTGYQQISPASSHLGNGVCFLLLLLFLRGVARSRAASTGPHSSRALSVLAMRNHIFRTSARICLLLSPLTFPSSLLPPLLPASTSRVRCRGLAVSVSTFSLGSEIRFQG
jgi:hypothetical protein